MREIVQNNSPRWLETVGYYISRDKVEGNISHGLQSTRGIILHNFPIIEQSMFVLYNA